MRPPARGMADKGGPVMAATSPKDTAPGLGEIALPDVALTFDPRSERLVLVCKLEPSGPPDVEIVEDDAESGLSRLIVDGVQVAIVRGPRRLVEDDFVLVDPDLADRLGLAHHSA